MSNMNNVSARRIVVYQILKDIMTPEECMKALWILEDKYAREPVVQLLEYVECIEHGVVKLGNHKPLINEKLTKNLYGTLDDNFPDPWDGMQAFKSNKSMT